MKFKSDIEVQAGLKDKDGQLGTAGQLLSSTGTQTDWIDQSTIIAAAATEVDIEVKNLDTITLAKGTPVYIVGTVGTSSRLQIAAAKAGDPAKMPSIGLLKQSLAVNGEGFVTVTGILKNITTDPIDGVTPNEGDTLYIKSTGGLTTVKPTGATNQIQNVGKVGRVQGTSAGSIVVSCIMRSNDVPNLPTGKIWVGDGNTIVSDTVFLDEPNGRMGIGTTNPAVTLDVQGSIFTRGGLYFTPNGSTSSVPTWGMVLNGVGDLVIDDTTGPQNVIFSNAGNVGIGTTSPGVKLTTVTQTPSDGPTLGSATTGGQALLASNGLYGQYAGVSNNGNVWHQVQRNDGPTATYNMLLQPSGGNVGIGTTAPGTKLEVRGTDPLLELNTSSATGNPYMMWSQAGVRRSYMQHVDSGDNLTIASEYGGMVFMTGASGAEVERMRITQVGNVGIDTTNPIGDLGIGSTSTTAIPRSIYLSSKSTGDSGGQSSLYLATSTGGIGEIGFGRSQFASQNLAGFIKYTDATDTFVFRTNFGDRMYLNGSGDLGVGVASPATKLSVNGGVQVADEPAAASAALVGTLRYRSTANTSFVDMCMQTGATTYTWVNIVSNFW